MNAMELEQQLKWNAIKAWRDLYISGLRVTHDGSVFQFWRNNWTPRLRVEEAGEFNRFDCTLLQPTDEHAALVAEYGQHWLKFFPKDVPGKLAGRFFHLLNKDYEFYPLQVELGKLGTSCYGLPLDGGIFPQIVSSAKVDKDSEDKPAQVPAILQEYLTGFGQIAERRF